MLALWKEIKVVVFSFIQLKEAYDPLKAEKELPISRFLRQTPILIDLSSGTSEKSAD